MACLVSATCLAPTGCDDVEPEPEALDFRHYRTDRLPDGDVEVIRVYVTGSLRNDEFFMDAVDEALWSWNDVGPLRFRFELSPTPPSILGPPITDAERPIVIKPASGGGCCPFVAPRDFEGTAAADPPFFELGRVNPGAEIEINVPCMRLEPIPVQRHVLMHELGHAVGLRHTDWETRASCPGGTPEHARPLGAQHIEGTPRVDPDSVMRACYDPSVTGTWSDGDRIAIRKLFGR
ncbi:MAG: M57 family metalloprotease [Myxococcota bacterium]